MYKNFLMLIVIAGLLISCSGDATQQKDEATQEATQEVTAEAVEVTEPVVIAVVDFKDKAKELVGQEILIEGTIIHVCIHGGKKMFIIGDNPDEPVKIVLGEEMVALQPEMEGKYVKVSGIVEDIDVEVPEGEGKEHEQDKEHKGKYNKKQYSVKCLKYAVKADEPPPPPEEEK